jgi:hypothetical protein
MKTVLGEPASPGRRQKRYCGRPRPIRRKTSGDPTFPIEVQHNLGRRIARAGAYGQSIWFVDAPTQRRVAQNGDGGPGQFRKVSHQLAAYKGRRVFGAYDRDDTERSHIKSPFAVLQGIARRDQPQGTGPRPLVKFAGSARDRLACSERHPGFSIDVPLHPPCLCQPHAGSTITRLHAEPHCEIVDGGWQSRPVSLISIGHFAITFTTARYSQLFGAPSKEVSAHSRSASRYRDGARPCRRGSPIRAAVLQPQRVD